MLEISIIARRRVWTYNYVFLNPSLSGSLLMLLLISPILFSLFSFLICWVFSFVYSPCTWVLLFTFFNEIVCTCKRKKLIPKREEKGKGKEKV